MPAVLLLRADTDSLYSFLTYNCIQKVSPIRSGSFFCYNTHMKINHIFTGVIAALIVVSCAFAEVPTFDPSQFEEALTFKQLGYGFYGTVPSIKHHFTRDISGQFGASVSQTSAAGQTSNSFILLLQGANIFKRLGDANLKYGGFMSFNNGTSSMGWTAAGTIGIEKDLAVNVTMALDVIPISFSSTAANGSSSSTIGLFSGTVISAHFYF